MIVITKSSEETQKIAETFAKKLTSKGLNPFRGSTPKALIIALHGELGSGKTAFVQGLAKGLGIKRRIISPTFVLVREHRIKNKPSLTSYKESRIMNLYHIDLYRIENVREIRSLGLEEIMNDQNSIVAIEWAEKIAELLPKEKIDIHFENVDENRRKIIIENPKY